MGFWKNNNGQGLIGNTTYSGLNCGTLRAYLLTFAPFQDPSLIAAATCTAVKNYVSTIIGNANSSGTTMNPMLKAQMLATALDVYFSDPAHGDPIKTYNGNNQTSLGGVKIDLTTICRMIDSTSGSTCSGTYYNVSAAFGGATSLTVNQMLAYAASQSNAGGSVWYGQVKATQEMAKNAFDAINNQVAFTAP